MTREEAIKVLENMPIPPMTGYSFNDISDALYIAVEALNQVTGKLNNPDDSLLTDDSEACKEQKSKLDLISRAEAIEALKRERTDEWCTDCKEYDTEKKCCPRFNKVIREAMKRVPHEDGTLEVKVEDATKVGRVLISDDKHRGGLYYPDEDEPKGDLISRQDAIDAEDSK